jgi:hypothetical protein
MVGRGSSKCGTQKIREILAIGGRNMPAEVKREPNGLPPSIAGMIAVSAMACQFSLLRLARARCETHPRDLIIPARQRLRQQRHEIARYSGMFYRCARRQRWRVVELPFLISQGPARRPRRKIQ